jgi:hypothetical protein
VNAQTARRIPEDNDDRAKTARSPCLWGTMARVKRSAIRIKRPTAAECSVSFETANPPGLHLPLLPPRIRQTPGPDPLSPQSRVRTSDSSPSADRRSHTTCFRVPPVLKSTALRYRPADVTAPTR